MAVCVTSCRTFFIVKFLSFLLAGTSIVIHGITGGKPENTLNVPRPTFYLERTFGLPIRRDYYSPVIDIGFHALGWKDKWDSPRHEWDPMICITFFRTWHLLWIFNWATKHKKDSITGSMATWEAILDYTRYDKSLSYVVDNHIWSYDRDGEKVYISIVPNMTREGLNKYSDESKHTEKDTEIGGW